jgi:hypothetical protein
MAKDWIAHTGSVSSFSSYVGQEPAGRTSVQRDLRNSKRASSDVAGLECGASMMEVFAVDRVDLVW